MAFDLDDDELKETRKDKGLDDGLYTDKMSEADKMFEKLGYKPIEMNVIDLIFEYAKEDLQERISFWASKEVAKTFKYANNSSQIRMEELKAINKKCQELGWLE